MIDSEAIKKDLIFFLKERLDFNDNEIYINPNIVLKDKDKTLIEKFLKQKEEGIPLDYILNSSKFYEYEFYVDSRVLIPRPETEMIIDIAEKALINKKTPKVLDIGTGSGCISIAFKKNRSEWDVHAYEKSTNAIKIAIFNSKINKTLINFKKFDIFSVFSNFL